MKIFFFSIMVLATIPFLFAVSHAILVPFEVGLQLDHVLYKQGDTVMMHVWRAGSAPANSTVYLKILDATSHMTGTTVVYQEEKNLVNNEARFNYTIPVAQNESNAPYRFLVQVYQNPDDLSPVNGVYFVTKDGAQKLVISKVDVLTPVVKPGETINFTAKVTDGLGNIISDIHVGGDSPQTNGGMDSLGSDLSWNNATKLFEGAIQVPQSWSSYPQQNGTYGLRITANPLYLGPPPLTNDYSIKGIIPVEDKSSAVQIIVGENTQNPSAIPEFPFIGIISMISMSMLVLFYKIRRNSAPVF